MKTASILLLSLVLVTGVGLSACDRSDRVEAARESDALNDRPTTLTAEEKEFVEYAAEMHQGEIDLAQLAKQKSTNEDVKKYADAVIAGHSDALKKLSERTGENRPTMGSLDTKYHAEYLSPMSGAQFDGEFISLMIADHQDATNTFHAQFLAAQNTELKNYLKEALPILEERLSDAQKIQKKVAAPKTE